MIFTQKQMTAKVREVLKNISQEKLILNQEVGDDDKSSDTLVRKIEGQVGRRLSKKEIGFVQKANFNLTGAE